MDEKQLQTVMEKIMTDYTKGLATKEEVKQAVSKHVGDYMATSEHAKALTDAQAAVKALQAQTVAMERQMKALLDSNFAAIKDDDGNYKGIWGSLRTAKEFGYCVLAECLIGERDRGINTWARKQLEGMGVQRRCILPNGEVKAINASDPTEGAALLPSAFIPRLITLIESYSAYRRWAMEVPLSAGDNSFPVQTSDVTVYCPGAGVAPTEGNIGFKNIALNPMEWAAYVAINRDVDEDTIIALGEVVGRSLARAFGTKEDQCGFIGDGTSTYFRNVGARVALRGVDATVTNVEGLQVQGTAGVWSAIDLQDLLGVAGRLADYAEISGEVAWVCSKTFYLTVMINAALTAGGAYAAEVMRPGVFTSPTFLDRPVLFGGGMPKAIEAADHCPLLYGNGKLGAALGDRRKFTIEQSTEVKFLERQRVIMGSERIAINNHGVGDTTNAGAIVGLWADIA